MTAHGPDDPERRAPPTAHPSSVLAELVVETAERHAVGRRVVAAPRAVHDVVLFEVAPRGAARRRAAPAVPDVDPVAGPPGTPPGVVPGGDVAFEQGQPGTPLRHAEPAPGK